MVNCTFSKMLVETSSGAKIAKVRKQPVILMFYYFIIFSVQESIIWFSQDKIN